MLTRLILTKRTDGFIVSTLLMLIITISTLLLIITQVAIDNYQYASRLSNRVNAQFAADAGLDFGIHQLNILGAGNYTGTTGEVTLLDTAEKCTKYEVAVNDTTDPETKIIRSTGRTYASCTSSEVLATRIFELQVEAVTSGTGPGSVVSGVGGLIVNNNAKITGGDVIVNGNVSVSNNAQIGLSTNPINLRVAHQNCPSPPNATYPQVCTSGQPITNNGLIYGDVQAQNQTNGAGMSNPGLTGSTFAPIAVPGYDRPSHKSAVATTYNASDAAVRCGNNQTRTWPANIKITGNFSLGNGCRLTITGNVWITGNVTFGNNSRIIIADSLLTTRPVIMVDGQSGFVTGVNTVITPNASGTGAEVISTWWNTNTTTNGGFTCGGIADPLDCTAVTGLALSTSQTVTTINLSNNTNASNTVFRTLWSKAIISNNGALGAVAGQTIELSQNAVINFTAAIDGSDNLVTTWVKRGYLRVFQ